MNASPAIAAIACIAACAGTTSPPLVAAARATAAPRVRDALSVLPAWSERPLVVALADGATGFVFGGARASVDAQGEISVAAEGHATQIVEARGVAQGWIFRDDAQHLWRAPTFLAPLVALSDGPATLRSPAHSRGSVAFLRGDAVHITDGREVFAATSLARAGLDEVVFCDATTAYAASDDGLIDVTRDGGHTWALDTGDGTACPGAVAPRLHPPPSAEVIAQVRREAAARARATVDAVTLDDGSAVSPDTYDAGCEVARWGRCAAVFCEVGDGAPSLRRVCARGEARAVPHPCRGAFVLSDDARHALCATAALRVVRIDADGGASAEVELPFSALPRTTLHREVALTATDGAIETRRAGAAVVRESVATAFDAVAWLDDAHLVGAAATRLWARSVPDGAWRLLGAVPWQPVGTGRASRVLARGDVVPALPVFACAPGECRFGAAIVRDVDALAGAPTTTVAGAPAATDERDEPPMFVADEHGACALTAPLTRRRALAGVPFNAPVHATLQLRAGRATIQWMTELGARAAVFSTLDLPGPLSPGDNPEASFPSGVPTAVAATTERLYLATQNARGGARLWVVPANGAPSAAIELPGDIEGEGEVEPRFEGIVLDDGALAVAASVDGDERTSVRVWVLSAAMTVTGSFAMRSRAVPELAVIDGAPGLVTLLHRGGDTLAAAFRGVATSARWRVRLEPRVVCGAPTASRGWVERAIDDRYEGAAAMVRYTRARLRFEGEGACIEAMRGVTATGEGAAMRAADVFARAERGAMTARAHDGLRAIAMRCR